MPRQKSELAEQQMKPCLNRPVALNDTLMRAAIRSSCLSGELNFIDRKNIVIA
jgi:hypothetical protein